MLHPEIIGRYNSTVGHETATGSFIEFTLRKIQIKTTIRNGSRGK